MAGSVANMVVAARREVLSGWSCAPAVLRVKEKDTCYLTAQAETNP